MVNQGWESIKESLLTIDASAGLPEDVFLAVSTLVPIVNVDLLILDDYNRILLIRRSDPYFGEGWHIPGGCVRFRETMFERIQKTAENEIGCRVNIEPTPIAVRDVIINDNRSDLDCQNYRAHHLAVLYKCLMPADYIIKNKTTNETEPGFIKWFDDIPDDLLRVHDVYMNDIKKEMKKVSINNSTQGI